MKFDFDFEICPVCGEDMLYDSKESECLENDCCMFTFDGQGEVVDVSFENGKEFCIPMYEKTWHRPDVKQQLKNELTEFLKEVERLKKKLL